MKKFIIAYIVFLLASPPLCHSSSFWPILSGDFFVSSGGGSGFDGDPDSLTGDTANDNKVDAAILAETDPDFAAWLATFDPFETGDETDPAFTSWVGTFADDDQPDSDSEVPDAITVGATGSVNDAAIPSGITRDSEWDSASEINAATTDADFLTSAPVYTFGTGLAETDNHVICTVTGSTTNEIQTIDTAQLSGTKLQLSLSSDGEAVKEVELSGFQDAAETAATIEDIMTGADAVTTVGDTDTMSIVVGGVLKKITGASAKSEFGGSGSTTGYIDFPCPIMADNTGASITSDVSSPLNGQSLFSDSADAAANYIRYPSITVPADFNSATDLTATFKIILANSDGLPHRYIISMCNVADSIGVVAPTFINPINLDFAGDASGAQYDVETIGPVTLTAWKTSLTAGDTLIIKVARDGDDETNDSSIVDSYSYGLLITYGK